jgi:hypothetical protein
MPPKWASLAESVEHKQNGGMDQRVAVTVEEFERALTVWLRLAPKSVERRWTKWLQLREQKRDSEKDHVDLAAEFAAVAASGMRRAGWEVTRRHNENIFAQLPPGHRDRVEP